MATTNSDKINERWLALLKELMDMGVMESKVIGTIQEVTEDGNVIIKLTPYTWSDEDGLLPDDNEE